MIVKIERLDDFGRGIAYINNKITFIENALEDEIVEIKIVKEHKKYNEGKVIRYIEKSKIRIDEICPYTNICGGCNLSHISIEEENKYKQNKIKNIINKFTDLDDSVIRDIKCFNELSYRNKITLHGKNNVLGLYTNKSNEVIKVDECLLVNNKINEIINVLNQVNENVEEAIIRTSNNAKEVILDIKGSITDIELLKSIVDVLIINGKYITKKKTIISEIGNYKYHVSAKSFFQVNSYVTKKLYDETLNVAKVMCPNSVLDLYCGTGTIGIYISKYCKSIVGVDYSESNIEDANKNKKLNNVKNIEFICDKVENRINEFKNIDLVVVDPPRAGLDKKTKENLIRISPKMIAYTSCDPVTLARDIKDLSKNYEVKYIQPFNNFPRTFHVECVSVLCRKNFEK